MVGGDIAQESITGKRIRQHTTLSRSIFSSSSWTEDSSFSRRRCSCLELFSSVAKAFWVSANLSSKVLRSRVSYPMWGGGGKGKERG